MSAPKTMSNLTNHHEAAAAGGPQSAEELLPLVYTELRRLARRRLALEPQVHTLQATALVHEVYLKLARQGDRRFNGTRHFLAAAAEAMRRFLVDQARRRKAQRRGGDFVRVEWTEHGLAAPGQDERLLILNEALDKLARIDPQLAEVVKLRYFGGLGFAQVAEALGISEPTAKRRWSYARVWLIREMAQEQTA
jgi:RNA polymerase sigma factor (TIGR02999 family)